MKEYKYSIIMNFMALVTNILIFGICAWLSYKFNNLWIMLIALLYRYGVVDNDKDKEDKHE